MLGRGCLVGASPAWMWRLPSTSRHIRAPLTHHTRLSRQVRHTCLDEAHAVTSRHANPPLPLFSSSYRRRRRRCSGWSKAPVRRVRSPTPSLPSMIIRPRCAVTTTCPGRSVGLLGRSFIDRSRLTNPPHMRLRQRAQVRPLARLEMHQPPLYRLTSRHINVPPL